MIPPRHAIAALVLVAGCGAPAAPPAPADMAMTAQSDLASAGSLDLEGRIIGLDRAGIAGVAVSLCQQACRDTITDAQGGFAFPGTPVGFHTLRARKMGDPDYAVLDFPAYLLQGSNPRLLPLVLPKVATKSAVVPGAQRFAVDASLALTLDGGALTLIGGGPVARLGGVRVPSDLFPNFCVPSARVLAMWAFSPTYVASRSPVGVEIGDSLGLAPGATVSFIDINPDDGRPAVVGSGSVSQDGKTIATAMGGGINRLGWLLASVISGGP